MANIFFNGEKLSKQEAINTLTVEVPIVNTPILEQHPDFPLFEVIPKWAGWRCQIVKCPVGYIDAILLAPEVDDY